MLAHTRTHTHIIPVMALSSDSQLPLLVLHPPLVIPCTKHFSLAPEGIVLSGDHRKDTPKHLPTPLDKVLSFQIPSAACQYACTVHYYIIIMKRQSDTKTHRITLFLKFSVSCMLLALLFGFWWDTSWIFLLRAFSCLLFLSPEPLLKNSAGLWNLSALAGLRWEGACGPKVDNAASGPWRSTSGGSQGSRVALKVTVHPLPVVLPTLGSSGISPFPAHTVTSSFLLSSGLLSGDMCCHGLWGLVWWLALCIIYGDTAWLVRGVASGKDGSVKVKNGPGKVITISRANYSLVWWGRRCSLAPVIPSWVVSRASWAAWGLPVIMEAANLEFSCFNIFFFFLLSIDDISTCICSREELFVISR